MWWDPGRCYAPRVLGLCEGQCALRHPEFIKIAMAWAAVAGGAPHGDLQCGVGGCGCL